MIAKNRQNKICILSFLRSVSCLECGHWSYIAVKFEAHRKYHLSMACTFPTLVNCSYKLSAELAVGSSSSQISYSSLESGIHLPI